MEIYAITILACAHRIQKLINLVDDYIYSACLESSGFRSGFYKTSQYSSKILDLMERKNDLVYLSAAKEQAFNALTQSEKNILLSRFERRKIANVAASNENMTPRSVFRATKRALSRYCGRIERNEETMKNIRRIVDQEWWLRTFADALKEQRERAREQAALRVKAAEKQNNTAACPCLQSDNTLPVSQRFLNLSIN